MCASVSECVYVCERMYLAISSLFWCSLAVIVDWLALAIFASLRFFSVAIAFVFWPKRNTRARYMLCTDFFSVALGLWWRWIFPLAFFYLIWFSFILFFSLYFAELSLDLMLFILSTAHTFRSVIKKFLHINCVRSTFGRYAIYFALMYTTFLANFFLFCPNRSVRFGSLPFCHFFRYIFYFHRFFFPVPCVHFFLSPGIATEFSVPFPLNMYFYDLFIDVMLHANVFAEEHTQKNQKR